MKTKQTPRTPDNRLKLAAAGGLAADTQRPAVPGPGLAGAMNLRRALPAILFVLIGVVSTLVGEERKAQVQISLYPYYHDPALAWRVTVFSDGTVRYEESAVPVEVWRVPPEGEIRWVERASGSRLSQRKQGAMLSQLRALDLRELQASYSAQYSYPDPSSETRVTKDSGESYTTPADVTRIVTHGATYRLQLALDDVRADSSVYAPFSALEWQSPEHPDRVAIAKIVTGWYHVLRAVGPVNGFKASMFRIGTQ